MILEKFYLLSNIDIPSALMHNLVYFETKFAPHVIDLQLKGLFDSLASITYSCLSAELTKTAKQYLI